jgi:hypothetical protein
VWTLINLTWRDDSWAAVRPRVRQLRALGVEDLLRALSNDSDADVKDRARAALSQFQKAEQSMG